VKFGSRERIYVRRACGTLAIALFCACAGPRLEPASVPRGATFKAGPPQDPNTAWVCRQANLLIDPHGAITIEDLQRTLCYLGSYAPHLDSALIESLQTAALASIPECHQASGESPQPRPPVAANLRELFVSLKTAIPTDADRPADCAVEAMIKAIVKTVGGDFRFRSIDDIQHTPAATAVGGNRPESNLLSHRFVYVRLPSVHSGDERLFQQALAQASQAHSVDGFVIDLRGANGGVIDALVRFMDLFVDEGVLMDLRYRDGRGEQLFATQRPPRARGPVVVLIDRRTSDGGEAYAAAMRSTGRAVLLGERTHGRTSFQSSMGLPSGSFLTVPVGELWYPGGGPIMGHGVAPDIEFSAAAAEALASGPDPLILLATNVLSRATSESRESLLTIARALTAPSPKQGQGSGVTPVSR